MTRYDVWVYVDMDRRDKLIIDSDSILKVSKMIKERYERHMGYMVIPKIRRQPGKDPIDAFYRYWRTPRISTKNENVELRSTGDTTMCEKVPHEGFGHAPQGAHVPASAEARISAKGGEEHG